MPKIRPPVGNGMKPAVRKTAFLWQASVRNISGSGDRSAYGLPGESGILLIDVPNGCLASKAGLRSGDVILSCGGKQVANIPAIHEVLGGLAGEPVVLGISRKQRPYRYR